MNHLRERWAARISARTPPGWERYVEEMARVEDQTHTADLWLPTSVVEHYREFVRGGANLEALDTAIKDVGIKTPLWIKTDGYRAILAEGNHRLTLAQRHGWSPLPVRVTMQRQGSSDRMVPLEPVLKRWIRTNPVRKLGDD